MIKVVHLKSSKRRREKNEVQTRERQREWGNKKKNMILAY